MALALLAAIVAAGCDRKPRFVPAGADSTAFSADSFASRVDQARSAWDTPDGGAEAAQLSAGLLRDALQNAPDRGVAERLRQQSDSLSFGAEIVGNATIAVANLFSSANPGGGSWPFLFWRDGADARHQQVEGVGLRLADLAFRPTGPGGTGLTGLVAVLFTRLVRSAEQPLVFVWRRPSPDRAWTLQQSLGADSLGGVGSARFQAPSADSVILVARTYQTTPRFDECPTCPHLYRNRMFRWTASGLTSAGEYAERTPYHTLVFFIRALEVGDRDQALAYVADPSLVDAAIGYEWGAAKGTWRVAPSADDRGTEMVIFRGSKEAYRVHFGTRGPNWAITGFEPTSRSIE